MKSGESKPEEEKVSTVGRFETVLKYPCCISDHSEVDAKEQKEEKEVVVIREEESLNKTKKYKIF